LPAPKILIVEDEALVATSLEMLLEDHGYDVVGWAVGHDDALAIAESHRPTVALVDIRLQDGDDGIALAGLLASRFDTAIIFLTAQSDPSTVARARAVRHRAYLRKPYDAGQVLGALREAAGDRGIEPRGVD